jgi:hypothetical protein
MEYMAIFQRLGATVVLTLDISGREDANASRTVDLIGEATGNIPVREGSIVRLEGAPGVCVGRNLAASRPVFQHRPNSALFVVHPLGL